MAVSFVGSKKATLERLFREKGINLTAEAQTRFDALSDQLLVFHAEIDSRRPDNARTAATRRSGYPRHPQRQDRAPAAPAAASGAGTRV